MNFKTTDFKQQNFRKSHSVEVTTLAEVFDFAASDLARLDASIIATLYEAYSDGSYSNNLLTRLIDEELSKESKNLAGYIIRQQETAKPCGVYIRTNNNKDILRKVPAEPAKLDFQSHGYAIDEATPLEEKRSNGRAIASVDAPPGASYSGEVASKAASIHKGKKRLSNEGENIPRKADAALGRLQKALFRDLPNENEKHKQIKRARAVNANVENVYSFMLFCNADGSYKLGINRNKSNYVADLLAYDKNNKRSRASKDQKFSRVISAVTKAGTTANPKAFYKLCKDEVKASAYPLMFGFAVPARKSKHTKAGFKMSSVERLIERTFALIEWTATGPVLTVLWNSDVIASLPMMPSKKKQGCFFQNWPVRLQ